MCLTCMVKKFEFWRPRLGVPPILEPPNFVKFYLFIFLYFIYILYIFLYKFLYLLTLHVSRVQLKR